MVNPFELMKVKSLWDGFQRRHPKLEPFGRTVAAHALDTGSVIDIHITDPEGKDFHYNMRLCQEDMDNLREIQEIFGKMANDYPGAN